jgi:hypothetical protein
MKASLLRPQEEYPGLRGEADTTNRPLGYLSVRMTAAKMLRGSTERGIESAED